MEKVKEILEKLEKEHEIKVVFAVEAGSRAWGLESEDSDYDIRFIYYKCKTQSYLSLKAHKDTIDGFSSDRVYDWQGWDITKALKMLQAMNPSIIEWIYSPIVYSEDCTRCHFTDEARLLAEKDKRIAPLLFHYRSMAKSNYKQHIEKRNKVNLKKYLYVIRPAGMVVWILKNTSSGKFLEIDFNKVLEEIKPSLGHDCYENIIRIIEIKKTLKEADEEERIACVDKWIEAVLATPDEQFHKCSSSSSHAIDDYDQILHSILKIQFN